MQILPALVEAYNHSGNPGRFELRSMNHESFDIVPTAAADGPQKPILDTVMSFDLVISQTFPASRHLERGKHLLVETRRLRQRRQLEPPANVLGRYPVSFRVRLIGYYRDFSFFGEER
jgi:hypothetical protein